ncbi:hypothetical protein [Oceanobacillus massiliensis]|uniref:hypothetical protein n=1 Tax=Oceanobacillus massiliensis TaxID=1465765 RepID=UPI0002886322|nr:hypothetical protein [Oceanobacillus massiliensis]
MLPIAQLIKLQDYISRYEWNTYRYPTQYIRLKNENWNKLYSVWMNPSLQELAEPSEAELESEQQMGKFSKLKAKLKRKQKEAESYPETDSDSEPEANEYADLPETEEALKQYFLNKLIGHQMKWATSTVSSTSFVDRNYYSDPLLKYLLQGFPDTYLIMYFPIFAIKKAPIESEILLISPIAIEIVRFLEESPNSVIMAGDERTWSIETGNEQKKILNPIIGLKRTERLVSSILASQSIDFPIKKTILSRTNSIIFNTEPYNTRIAGKKDYADWFKEKRRLTSPLKNIQLKAAEALLKNCQTTSIKRPDWEKDDAPSTVSDLEE